MSEWKYRIELIGDDSFGLFLVRYPDQSEWRLILTMEGNDHYKLKLATWPISAVVLARALGFDESHASQPARDHVTWDQFKQRGAEAIAETVAALSGTQQRQVTPSPLPSSKPTVLAPASAPKQASAVKQASSLVARNWSAAMAARLRELREVQAQDYRDVQATLNKEFGTSYSLSAVKAKAARMQLSNYLEMAVEPASSAPDPGEGKASTPEEEGDVASPGPQLGAPPQVHPTHEDIIEAALSEHRLASEKRSSALPGPDDGRESPATFYPKVKVPTTIYDVLSWYKYQGHHVEQVIGGYTIGGGQEVLSPAELVRRANVTRKAGGAEPFVLEAEEVVPLHTEAAE